MCMTILAGRKATQSGEILIGHNEDAPGRFIMQTHIVRKQRRKPNTHITFEPDLAPLELSTTRINLLWSEARTCSEKYSDSAFCDLYVNGHGVVICSNNCADSREDSPELTDGGIGYGLRRLVAERAHSAREAVSIACELVGKWGYASSGRSYAFADRDEIFVMQVVSGKHWAIQRVPDDEVAVIPNHYTIHDPDKKAPGYSELVGYAQKRGWYSPENGDFDFARVYQSPETWGLDKNTYRHVKAFEILLDMDLSELHKTEWQGLPFSIKPARKVSIDTMKAILRAHEANPHFSKPLTICNTETLESTIVQIRSNQDRIVLRKALGRPDYSPYLVWYFGLTDVPEEYEDSDAEKALAEHFHLEAEAMDWKNSAWFRSAEIGAVSELLSDEAEEAVCGKIREFEAEEEREIEELDPQIELSLRSRPDIARAMMKAVLMKWTEKAEWLTQTLREELGVVVGEPLTAISEGENFRVRLHGVRLSELDTERCICGSSCTEYSAWSKCAGVNESEGWIEFSGGEWRKNAVPCFTDLYMLLVDNTGKKRVGCVKIQVRR
ncbi:MAG: C69 family dipeptidase [Synergistaceae bacterium]|nr:C69 family dipeptidase [Synergistaceae bacterium]